MRSSTHATTAAGQQNDVEKTGSAPAANTHLGCVVQAWCARNEYTQGELADAAGVSRGQLSRLVNGARSATSQMLMTLEYVMHTGGELEAAACRDAERHDNLIPARRRPAPAQLPPARGVLYGRDHEMAALAPRGTVPGLRLLICGPPGAGKTALAVQHAHRVAPSYSAGTLWADLRGHRRRSADPSHILADFLATLGLPVPDTFEDRVREWRSATWSSRLLIVLDDACSTDQITSLLPAGNRCAVLITSRFRLSSVLADGGCRTMSLGPLPRTASLQLLRTVLGERVNDEPAVAEAIAEDCGDLPRSLVLAAERLAVHPTVPLTKLVAEHADRWELTEIGDEPETSMRATLHQFSATLPKNHQSAWHLMSRARGHLTSAELANLTGWNVAQARNVLDGLVLAHLAVRQDSVYTMPPLFAAWGMHMRGEPEHTAAPRAPYEDAHHDG
ncbi:NB-ARC domain-containing protein [Saccharopolyspora sp. NPDC049426]|uniref:NB-ARC domain-containing protein n=1 Tax=Saccharopolyspora sp. NPDC049426 TaxID=3155652 RepID=UPI003447078A